MVTGVRMRLYVACHCLCSSQVAGRVPSLRVHGPVALLPPWYAWQGVAVLLGSLGLVCPQLVGGGGGGEEEECASVSGCTLLDCSACKHVGCNQQALHSLQSLLSGATPVGHAKWHTLTDHLPHNSSGLRVQEVYTTKTVGSATNKAM